MCLLSGGVLCGGIDGGACSSWKMLKADPLKWAGDGGGTHIRTPGHTSRCSPGGAVLHGIRSCLAWEQLGCPEVLTFAYHERDEWRPF